MSSAPSAGKLKSDSGREGRKNDTAVLVGGITEVDLIPASVFLLRIPVQHVGREETKKLARAGALSFCWG
jgi:hypothetical protein